MTSFKERARTEIIANGTLSIDDFDFIKAGYDEKEIKGTVRRKLQVMPNIMKMFKSGLMAQENLIRNRIVCTFATADNECTFGFTGTKKSRPMTLVKGNILKKPSLVEIILKREKGATTFDEIVLGSRKDLDKYMDAIRNEVAFSMLDKIVKRKEKATTVSSAPGSPDLQSNKEPQKSTFPNFSPTPSKGGLHL